MSDSRKHEPCRGGGPWVTGGDAERGFLVVDGMVFAPVLDGDRERLWSLIEEYDERKKRLEGITKELRRALGFAVD